MLKLGQYINIFHKFLLLANYQKSYIVIYNYILLHVSTSYGSSSGRNIVTRDAYDTYVCPHIIQYLNVHKNMHLRLNIYVGP
jgi:lysyl-tRNA synthetase class I